MARRGFLAELHRLGKIAAKEQARAAREQVRAHNAAIREAERALKAREREAAQMVRANEAELKYQAKLAREEHVAAMEMEVEALNLDLAQVYDEIDSLLVMTLDVDDYVDLETLRVVVEHPPFGRADLEVPTPVPEVIADPPEPIYDPPAAPSGILGFLGKKRHEKAVAEAAEAHKRAVSIWRGRLIRTESARQAAASQHAEAEARRISMLAMEQERYLAECSAREKEAAERNEAVDALIANLGYGVADAVQEYVSIVLSNSVYPECFPVKYEFIYDAPTAELRLRASVPGPDKLPAIKAYKYTKASDSITAIPLPQKACKERYANAICQVALRSIHEIFEADRRGLIKTISLEVGSQIVSPATGRDCYVIFVAVGAERDSFLEINLANVVPATTLNHLGAIISKNPFDLVAVDVSGVRNS